MRTTNRKPHSDYAGYLAERRNPYSGGHTVICDCKRAADEGQPLVQDYIEEGGRYQILCDTHGHLIYSTDRASAYAMMKDPTIFCMLCRCIAGEGPEDWERQMTSEEVVTVWMRKRQYDAQGNYRYVSAP